MNPFLTILLALIAAASLGAFLLLLSLLSMGKAADRDTPQPGSPEESRRIAARWWLSGALADSGYWRVVHLLNAGKEARVYWSGGEMVGTRCVWAGNRRYSVEEWNQESIDLARIAQHSKDGGERC